jgi:SAM-dependent methyltransferase
MLAHSRRKMDSTSQPGVAQAGVASAIRQFWSEQAARKGAITATGSLLAALWEFVRDSTPARQRQRFGDADYDWDYRVNTTSGAMAWRDRLLGVFHSPYQPTDPALFREMLDALAEQARISLSDFTFVDLGSGKGRTLLMASDYPFRRILGVELLPSLHRLAQENLRAYKSDSQKCFTLEAVCGDATTFALPEEPLVIYLFNPFPEPGMRRFLLGLQQSLEARPRAVYVLYHNPQLEPVLSECAGLRKIGGTHQYSLFAGGSKAGGKR